MTHHRQGNRYLWRCLNQLDELLPIRQRLTIRGHQSIPNLQTCLIGTSARDQLSDLKRHLRAQRLNPQGNKGSSSSIQMPALKRQLFLHPNTAVINDGQGNRIVAQVGNQGIGDCFPVGRHLIADLHNLHAWLQSGLRSRGIEGPPHR